MDFRAYNERADVTGMHRPRRFVAESCLPDCHGWTTCLRREVIRASAPQTASPGSTLVVTQGSPEGPVLVREPALEPRMFVLWRRGGSANVGFSKRANTNGDRSLINAQRRRFNSTCAEMSACFTKHRGKFACESVIHRRRVEWPQSFGTKDKMWLKIMPHYSCMSHWSFGASRASTDGDP